MDADKTMQKWLNAFAKDVAEHVLQEHVLSAGNYLWHLFSYGYAPCLEGDAARKAFDALRYESAFKFRQAYVKVERPEGRCLAAYGIELPVRTAKLTAAQLEKNRKETDVYIVAEDFSWTYVHTHEDGWCGPYFARR